MTRLDFRGGVGSGAPLDGDPSNGLGNGQRWRSGRPRYWRARSAWSCRHVDRTSNVDMLDPAARPLYADGQAQSGACYWGSTGMPSFPLTDVARDLWVDSFSTSSTKLGLSGPAWSVAKRTLRGGRRDGVDLIEVQCGDLAFSVAPTRGMGLWRASFAGDRVGWTSPVKDGPVNPAFVNLVGRGGLGWLDGFDELLARCGLSHNGAPYREGDVLHAPARQDRQPIPHFVAVHVDDEPPHVITIEGQVDETELFFTQMRMTTRISAVPGLNGVIVRDAFTNQSDSPATMQVLYHWNLKAAHGVKGRSGGAVQRPFAQRRRGGRAESITSTFSEAARRPLPASKSTFSS